jgi:hypothetical protein
MARVGNSGASCGPDIHIQAQTLPTGITDIAMIDGPRLLKTLHTYPLLFRGASLVRAGNESWPTAVDPRRGDFVRLSADEIGGALPGCYSAIRPWSAAKGTRPRSGS